VNPETQLIDAQPLKTRSSGTSAVLQLVESCARQHPETVALLAAEQTLNYGELNRRANRLAHHLRELGVGPEQVVGICIERSAASVISALATFKAGGAYLPLDPVLPEQRLAFMLQDAKVSAVISTAALNLRLPAGPWAALNYDEVQFDDSRSVSEIPAEISSNQLAYVIYTSGSTGQPKGVEVTHDNLLNLVSWHLRAFDVRGTDRAALQSSVGFDAAVWELWPYLACGASVAIADETVRNNPEAMRDWMLAKEVTIGFLSTAIAERIISLTWPKTTPLRVLLTGAEALHKRPTKQLPFALVNNYGPTECTVVATSGPVLADASSSLPSIGRPIDNTFIRILDTNMRPLPDGERGEVYIGGAGVARGYRHNPTLTAERFLRDPFNRSGRLYRTGDLARFLPNGEIEFLGRLDEQIKIRGFRVEPAEIVGALNSYPGVKASAVMLLGGDSNDKRIVAYVVLEPEAQVTVFSLRETLAKKLPEYMVPSMFRTVPSLPLTASGKIDYRALPKSAESRPLPETEFVAPQTLVELRLAAILAPLLHIERVGTKDNFFLLGGHSLLGTQLITKIKESFDVDLSLLSLFDHPTLEEMSVEVENLILAKMGVGDGNGASSPHGVSEGSK
jgi:amino acid adenylation domain-containing protein